MSLNIWLYESLMGVNFQQFNSPKFCRQTFNKHDATRCKVIQILYSSAAIETEAEELGKKVNEAQQIFDETSKQLETRKIRLRECDGEISALLREIENSNKQLTDCNVERKKTEHK